MPHTLRATRQALKLGLLLGAASSLAGFGLAGATAPRPGAGALALRTGSAALALAPVQPPREAAATGTVDLPPGAAGEPGGERRAGTEYDYGRAHKLNAALPFSKAPIIAALPFQVTGEAGDRERALTCLTQAVYYEAGFEPLQGERAVAQVILNRMRHGLFPHSVCGVVFQGAVTPGGGCQFSFTCDGSLGRGAPAPAAWKRAQDVARAALNGYVEASIGLATHYHTDYVAPYWMTTVTKMARVGQHIFYRWPGTLGLPAAYGARYAAVEHIPSTTQLMLAAQTKGHGGVVTFHPGQGVTLGADGAIYVAQSDDAPSDGRVHTRILTGDAASEGATPQARRAAVLAGHAAQPAGGLETLAPETAAAPSAPASAGEN